MNPDGSTDDDGSRTGAAGHLRATRRSLPIALLRARESVMAHFRPMLTRHDLTEQQWRVMRVLAEDGELDATQLAARALILAPSLTRMIRLLERRGLILLRKDTEDGRRTLVRIAPEGLALIDRISPESAAIYRMLEDRCGGPELDELMDRLERLIGHLGQPEAPPED
ncbi:homoprotocatechuate degradation operon regulator HpaR [Microvirga tunisiensis]|uniref:Homoprotocatechuate degradation operon regulator HpaR n=2 Tax=Pannonibacter tanglangensis TaxID=2750084 RepID=A0ABW9ZH06_9HYPH|nr:homoprotocatechuate degradation operon regulator HpaR [Pannonibacter sp. XCT-34]NBN78100.1 homoprotocatechuate degradation operon regulator HpaR [Pannonibacter sp. XCT-53]